MFIKKKINIFSDGSFIFNHSYHLKNETRNILFSDNDLKNLPIYKKETDKNFHSQNSNNKYKKQFI